MNTSQTTLTDTDDTNDFPDRSTTPDDSSTNVTENAHYTTLAPPDQRGGHDCCPWCLAAADTFEHHEDGRVGCGYCDAAIPINAEWYERGEKIVV